MLGKKYVRLIEQYNRPQTTANVIFFRMVIAAIIKKKNAFGSFIVSNCKAAKAWFKLFDAEWTGPL